MTKPRNALHDKAHIDTVTPKQAAQRLNLTTPEVMDWVRHGRLPVIERRGPHGTEYRIPRAAVDAAYRGLPWSQPQPSHQRPPWLTRRLARRAFVTLAGTSAAAAAGLYATRWLPDSGAPPNAVAALPTPSDAESQLGSNSGAGPFPSSSTSPAPGSPSLLPPSDQRVALPPIDLESLIHGGIGRDGANLGGPGIVPAVDNHTTWEIFIPSARVRAAIVGLGLTPSRALGAPDNPDVIGWWQDGPAPGASGNVLLDGHRDFTDTAGNVGLGVNWLLPGVQRGDLILVADRDAQQSYLYTISDAFPVAADDPSSARFLQRSNLPILTLITCEGSFDESRHAYNSRRIVIAVLQGIADGLPA